MRRPLFVLAWLNVALHVAGLAFAAFGMRPGTAAVPREEQLRYLTSAPQGWVLGWVTWMLCAISLIAFLAVAVNRLSSPAPMAQLGLTIAVVGAAFDLFCDLTYIVTFPWLASTQNHDLFIVLERLTGIASLVIANGAYSIAILLIAAEMKQSGRVRFVTSLVGTGVFFLGMLLVLAGFTGIPLHAQTATGPTIVLFCVWVLLVARDLERPT